MTARAGLDRTSIGTLALVTALVMGGNPGASFAAQRSTSQKKPSPAASTTPVDKVVELVLEGLGEDLVVQAIQKEGLRSELSSADMIRLKRAGATDRVIGAMLPSAPVAAAAVPTPTGTASVSTAATAPRQEQLRRAAIEPFAWATVKTPTQEIFNTNVDIGRGFQALLVNRVQQGGKIRVVERANLQVLIDEQDTGGSNRVKRGTNARIGQLAGADVYLMGDIVAFGRDDRKKSIGIGGILGWPGVLGGIGIGSSEDKAVVVVNYRLVDAETGEIIDTGEARGESVRKSKGIKGIFGGSGGILGGAIDMTSANFANTIIGEATIAAADRLATILNDKATSLPHREVDVEARIALVSGGVVTLAKGADDGIEVGDRFEVFRIVQAIKDPVTGEVLDQEVAKLGELVITSVRERVAVGSYQGQTVTSIDGLARKVLR